MAACESIRAAPPIHVAFNPYFPSKAEAAEERKRLIRKLDTGLVRGIYLQMGTDLERLKQGLDFLKDVSRNQHSDAMMDLFGSVFLPTKRCTSDLLKYLQECCHISLTQSAKSLCIGCPVLLQMNMLLKAGEMVHHNSNKFALLGLSQCRLLAQMRFRPWNGVFLSEEYLSSVDKAQAITAEILAVYSQHGVIPLVESSLRTTQELRQCLDLLEGATKK